MRSLNYLLKNCKKPTQQIDIRAVADLATSHTAENIGAVNDLVVLSRKSARGTHKNTPYTSDRQGN